MAPTESKVEKIVLLFLELVDFVINVYGLYFQYQNISTIGSTGMAYCSIWYILESISSLLGMYAIWQDFRSTEDEDVYHAQLALQYHYLLAWVAVVLGYPLMVNYTWLMYYPTWLAYLHILLAVIPLFSWILHSGAGIVRTTQICTTLAAASHFFVCFLANDVWGWSSAAVMIVNVIALSTPTKYHVWVFNSRELFIIGLVATSFLMNNSIIGLTDPKKRVKSLNIFNK